MAEGIMGLAPGMGAPAAPQQAPQAPQADPRGVQAFMDATSQMDPAEVQGQMDETIGEVDPALAQQIQADLSAVQLSPEIIEVLLGVVDELLEVPQQYVQSRMEFIEAGLPAEFLPEEFDLEYLSTLRYVLTHLTPQEAAPPVQGFKKGGPVSLKPIAQFLASQGRGGDTILAHINKSEAAMLKRMGGAGTINPVTGLVEYNVFKKAKDKVTKALKNVGSVLKKVVAPVLKVTKKLLSNPLVRTAAMIATAVFFPPAAMFSMTAGTAAAAAVNYSIATTGISLLAGEKPKDALKQGLIAGAGAGTLAYLGGAPLTGSTQDMSLLNSPNVPMIENIKKVGNSLNPFGTTPAAAPLGAAGAGAGAAGAAGAGAAGAAAAPGSTTFLGMTVPQALTTAATVVPPILSYMGSKEPPPSPKDLDVPGVGGPTGAELLAQNPDEYGIKLGETTSTFAPTAQNISTVGLGEAAFTAKPSSTSVAAANPLMSTLDAAKKVSSEYDPTKDPMSPLYNPFASPAQVAAASNNLTGGFDTRKGFAQGGIATLDQNMFAPPSNVNVSPTNIPANFANGGISAMAPYKFSRGSNPTQQYPRRTGPINGPGTGTSDSIPAMLSDGEFVFTAKAVRNIGGGSRLDGAKKMYKMMKMLERKS